jgi:signal peptidase II
MSLLPPRIAYAVAGAIFLVDLITKRIVLWQVDAFSGGIPLIDGLLRFTYVRNAGAAFGIFQGGRWPFIVVSTAAVLGLSWLLHRRPHTRLRGTAYALILGGAAGNLVDRIFYDGLVVDFVEMGWKGSTFPVYNVADMGVSIGAALLILAMLTQRHEDPVEAEQPTGATGDSGAPPSTDAVDDERPDARP